MNHSTGSNSEEKLILASITNRVDSIQHQLCECEESTTEHQKDDDTAFNAQHTIMDLLEMSKTIQDAAQMLLPYTMSLRARHQEMESQIKSLNLTLQLLEMEKFKE